jgi:hypothetical protein
MLAILACEGGDEAPAELQKKEGGGIQYRQAGNKMIHSIMAHAKHITTQKRLHCSLTWVRFCIPAHTFATLYLIPLAQEMDILEDK